MGPPIKIGHLIRYRRSALMHSSQRASKTGHPMPAITGTKNNDSEGAIRRVELFRTAS
jgi:hypothetical protein